MRIVNADSQFPYGHPAVTEFFIIISFWMAIDQTLEAIDMQIDRW